MGADKDYLDVILNGPAQLGAAPFRRQLASIVRWASISRDGREGCEDSLNTRRVSDSWLPRPRALVHRSPPARGLARQRGHQRALERTPMCAARRR